MDHQAMDHQDETRQLGAAPVRDEVLKEVRLAVVIYGGVSLAIYINGIVQEMLHMVRATAPSNVDAPADGSEVVYRKLSQLLGDPDHGPAELAQQLATGQSLPLRTRFVIDILSGTSAGGINAIFLGKALVNNQSLDGLQQLWISQGNIESLINDSKSLNKRLSLQSPPRSLLNGSRMYLELLSALDAMDLPGPPAQALVENLDLFATTTDLSGLNVPLTLADGVVIEKRHRSVFHFQYSNSNPAMPSCFAPSENPFLAFAARSTSAFPFAFEPMELNDIFTVLNSAPAHWNQAYCDPDTNQWQRYYKDYLGSNGRALGGRPFQFRAFGDGGYLDNKPFSYAIDTMLTRHAGLPVERKLVYIEPNPEEMTGGALADSRPNAIENSLAALLVLPRYETIREDLERVVNRNLQIEQIGRVVDSVRSILDAPTSGAVPTDWLKGRTQYGSGYATYERLKLSTVTDDLSNLLAVAFGTDPRGAYGMALRTIGSVWRDLEYPTPESQRRFLLDFDVNYRLRRIRQIWRCIQEEYYEPNFKGDVVAYRAELQRIKAKLRPPYVMLQRLLQETLLDPADTQKGILSPEELNLVVEPPPDLTLWKQLSGYRWAGERSIRGSQKRAQFLLVEQSKKAEVTGLAGRIAARFRPVMITASTTAQASFARADSVVGAPSAARDFVRNEYESFEKYDSAAFPITFGTDVDDSRPIDIHRISPRDAKARDQDVLAGREKLRGQRLGAFGGFLDETWRRNDILWGRLDGAERLITMLLPEPDPATVSLRKQLIDEAHEQIVIKMLGLNDEQRAEWKQHLRAFVLSVPTQPAPELVARSAARATAVVGDLLAGISTQQSNPARHLMRRMAFAGRMAWSLVEVSVPRTPLELFGNYWLQLLMLFSLMLVVIAAISSNGYMWKIAGLLVLASVLLYLGRETLRRYLRGEFIPSYPVLALGTAAVVVALTTLETVLPLPSIELWHSARLTWGTTASLQRLIDSAKALPLQRWDQNLVFAALFVATGAALATLGAARRARALRSTTNVMQTLKFAITWTDVAKALGETDRDTRAAVVRALRADTVFASAYGIAFGSLGSSWLLAPDPRPVIRTLASLVIVCGLTAAIANLRGNAAVYRLTHTPLPGGPGLDAPLPCNPSLHSCLTWLLATVATICSVALWLV
jgi:patatin-related protein